MSGGFIPPSPPKSASPHPQASATAPPPDTPLLSLTPQQEHRLWTHIDDRLLSLERDERKHAFGSLDLLLNRLSSLLSLILQIPPVDPWGGVRVSYLLTLTGSIMTYITSLPLVTLSPPMKAANKPMTPMTDNSNGRQDEKDEDEAAETARVERAAVSTMRKLLDFLNMVDKGWLAVLRGDAWITTVPSAKAAGSTTSAGRAVPVDFGVEVGATERIRLRSIIISSRSKFLAWARTYGDFSGVSYPLEQDKTEKTTVQGEDDGPVDMVEVTTPDDEGLEWEREVIGMWNGTLEKLSNMDFGRHMQDDNS